MADAWWHRPISVSQTDDYEGSVTMTAIPPGNPVTQDFSIASSHIAALTGQDGGNVVIDARMIHDVQKDVPAIPLRGTLQQLWTTILTWQSQGFGSFVNVNEMDGSGLTLANVKSVRAHVIDLDNLSSQQNYERATQFNPPPSFAVQSSPGRFHVYWAVQPFVGNERAALINRKLRQLFDADRRATDPTRVLRLAGTLHLKDPAAPHLVRCWALAGFGQRHDPKALETALASVNVIEGGSGQRHDLGEPSLAAPSLDWLRFALRLLDPNSLDRGEWISFSAAVKQAGWTLVTHEQELFDLWSEWCSRYDQNDQGENLRQWSSFRQTEIGWPSIERRVPTLTAYRHLMVPASQPAAPTMPGQTPQQPPPAPPMPAPPELDCSGEMLTHMEQQTWFKGCVLIGPENRIIDAKGQEYDVGAFNSTYGGKRYIIDAIGKQTDEAWKAATRSTLWTVPKVDGTSFRPDLATGTITTDELGRRSVNVYVAAKIDRADGDPSPFLNHLAAMLPVESDRKILLDYMAHNARFPGYKIPWAPLIQSTEGAGKNVIKYAMAHVMGDHYTYPPNPKELATGGGKFNDWMHRKLFLIADEIRTDDRRDLVEVLKPMISETKLEMQKKGRDQRKADNPANWLFFSNFKDAIPVHKNGRRFAIFYSAIQTVDDLTARGMNDVYFSSLYSWLGDDQNGGHRTGLKIVANYLMTYPIERGAIPKRAPQTTSTAEALIESRGWLEQLIAEAVEDGLPGFRGGWISTAAVTALVLKRGNKPVAARTLGTALGELKYHNRGQAGRAYFQDDPNKRGYLWSTDPAANISNYGRAQGYE